MCIPFLNKLGKQNPAILRLIMVILLFGLSWPALKVGLTCLTPLWFATIRLFVAALCLFAFVSFRKALTLPRKEHLPILFSGGVMMLCFFMCLTTAGLHYLSAGRSAILAYTTPLWVMPISVLFFDEKMNTPKTLGFMLGITGLVILLWPVFQHLEDKSTIFGCALVLLGAMFWGFTIVHFRHTKAEFNPIQLAPWQMLIGSILSAGFALYYEPHFTFHWTLMGTLSLLFVIATLAICFVNMTILNRTFSATTMSLSILGVPMVGLISSMLIIHEHFDLDLMIGMATIIAGIALTLRGSARQQLEQTEVVG